jgi:hypothetical protein
MLMIVVPCDTRIRDVGCGRNPWSGQTRNGACKNEGRVPGRGGAVRNEGRVSKFDMGPWVTKRKRLEPGNQDGSSRGWYALLRRR